MKISNVLLATALATGAFAVYPAPNNVKNGDVADSDLVTIQDTTNNGAGSATNSIVELDGSTIATQKQASKDTTGLKKESKATKVEVHEETESLSSLYSFYLAISMIVVSEIGDKTFLIAAIMAMRHPRMVVFSAASAALVLMTVLSGLIGHILPSLLSPTLTRAAAAILFLVFGFNLLKEGLSVDKGAGVEEELAEVEEEIAAVELNELSSNLEKGQANLPESVPKNDWKKNVKDLMYYVSSPVWFQTFSMTFLGEWGDRSQITTIAMAAGSDWKMIILGGSIGHMLCTLLAVLAGQFISTKISLRTILFGGSVAFFIFSILYGYSALYE